MYRRLLLYVLPLALMLVCSACQEAGISSEPTPYLASYTASAGNFKTQYLLHSHPDVTAATALVDETLRSVLNRSWETVGDMQPVMTNGMRWRAGTSHQANKLSHELQDYEIKGIAFVKNIKGEIDYATARVDSVIRFTDATSEWLQQNDIELGKDYLLALDILMQKSELGDWQSSNSIYTHPPQRVE